MNRPIELQKTIDKVGGVLEEVDSSGDVVTQSKIRQVDDSNSAPNTTRELITQHPSKSTTIFRLVPDTELEELTIDVKTIKSRVDSMKNQLSELLYHRIDKIYIVPINDLAHDEWMLNNPLMVAVEQHGEEDFIARFYDADVYGYGDSIPEALDDLKVRLVDQLELLLKKEKQSNLESEARKQLKVLRRHIRKCQQESNPWLEFAGIFENEPLFDDVLKEIEAHRQELDEDSADE